MSVDVVEAQGVNAQLRQRAEMNLEACTAELHAIAERARGYQTELLQLSTERVNLQVKRDELTRTLQAALADREQAVLELDVAFNTLAEQEAQARLTAIDSLIEAAGRDILLIDTEYGVNEGILRWRAREYNLQEFVKDCFRERDELLKKRAALEAIAAKAKAAQGLDEQARLVAEFDALATQEKDLQEQIQALADLRRELQALISRRLSDWPLLAAETEQAHGPYTPPATVQAIALYQQYCQFVEEHATEIDVETIRRLVHPIPAMEMQRMGGSATYASLPREKQSYPIALHGIHMDEVEAYLRREHERARKRQAEARAFS